MTVSTPAKELQRQRNKTAHEDRLLIDLSRHHNGCMLSRMTAGT